MGSMVWAATSVSKYYYSLRNDPEERSSQLLRDGSLNSRVANQKVSVHPMITIQKVTSNVQSSCLAQSDCPAADRQGQRDTTLTLTPSVIPNSNYVIVVRLKYFCLFFVLSSLGAERLFDHPAYFHIKSSPFWRPRLNWTVCEDPFRTAQ
jgi:hypothetical protein